MSELSGLVLCVVITYIIQWGGFLVAYALQTETFYDVLGGVNFLCLAAYSAAFPVDASLPPWNQDAHKVAITLVFVCSRSWLLIFLGWRARERAGDTRFEGVTDDFGSFLIFWTVQGVWVLTISLPVLFVNFAEVYRPHFSTADWLLLAGFAVGVVLEANGKSLKRYYDNPEVAAAYGTYRKNTSILLPMVGYAHVPLLIKRTIFLDFKRYEYRPRALGGAQSAGSSSGRVEQAPLLQ